MRSQFVLKTIADYVRSKTGIDIETISDDIRSLPTKRIEDDAYYTLQGQKVVRPVKGVYIHRGKKVVMK